MFLQHEDEFALFESIVGGSEVGDGVELVWVVLEVNVSSVVIDISIDVAGDFVLVVDNSEQPVGGAVPVGDVEVSVVFDVDVRGK